MPRELGTPPACKRNRILRTISTTWGRAISVISSQDTARASSRATTFQPGGRHLTGHRPFKSILRLFPLQGKQASTMEAQQVPILNIVVMVATITTLPVVARVDLASRLPRSTLRTRLPLVPSRHRGIILRMIVQLSLHSRVDRPPFHPLQVSHRLVGDMDREVGFLSQADFLTLRMVEGLRLLLGLLPSLVGHQAGITVSRHSTQTLAHILARVMATTRATTQIMEGVEDFKRMFSPSIRVLVFV